MKNKAIPSMKPQDIVVLLKLIALKNRSWNQIALARELFMSQSEISESLARSRYARLIFNEGRKVHRQNVLDFIKYGLAYVFPQQPGSMSRGTLTAHSALPLKEDIESNELYVWPYAKGTARGYSIRPLYPSVLQAIEMDQHLYELLALTDAIRVGRTRERNLALKYLRERIC